MKEKRSLPNLYKIDSLWERQDVEKELDTTYNI